MPAYPKVSEMKIEPVQPRDKAHALELLKEETTSIYYRFLAKDIAATAVAKAIALDVQREIQSSGVQLLPKVGSGPRRLCLERCCITGDLSQS